MIEVILAVAFLSYFNHTQTNTQEKLTKKTLDQCENSLSVGL